MNGVFIAATAAALCLLTLFWLVYRYSFLVPAARGLPILLYHKVSRDLEDRLTISVARLDSQLAYLRSQGYEPVSFSDLKAALDRRRALPPKPILLTFDDAYLNNYELAYPILHKHQCKATIFLPVGFIGQSNAWDGGAEPLMSYEQIRRLAAGQIEFGLHSYRHENYQRYSAAQIETDVSECVQALAANGCAFAPVFAYPYGRMPDDAATGRAMRDSFRRHGIDFAVRIGSRINPLPPKDPYRLTRTCIDGTDSFREFKIKLRKGRSRLF